MAATVDDVRMAVKRLPRTRLSDIPWRPPSAEKAVRQPRVRPWPWPSPVRPSAVNKAAA